MENGGTDVAGTSGTSGEDDLILPATSQPRCLAVYVVNDNAPFHLAPIREEVFEDGTDGTEVTGAFENVDPEAPVCRNGCSPHEENGDLDVLVKLGCICSGSMSRMCKKCILKWFAPRILVHNDKTCEACHTRLNKRVRQTVFGGFADHAGKAILNEAVGEALVEAHEARHPHYNANGQMLLNVLAPHGAAVDASDIVPVVPPPAPDHASDIVPVVPPPAPDHASDIVPVAAPEGAQGALVIQQPPKSFWKRIRRYMCCASAPAS